MSNFARLRSLQAPNFSASHVPFPGQDCALCGTASGDSVVCAQCEAALPRLSSCCAWCAAALAHAGICGQCQRRAPAYDAAIAAFEYRFPVDRVIHRFKYSADLAMGRWLALELALRATEEARPELLVAPPLTAARLRERGFNQALEIARTVGKRLGLRCAIAALEKVRETAPQPGLTRSARRRNLRHAFRCRVRLSGEHVAIVDDVMTTGATAEAIATILKAAGAGRVSVWTVARTPDPAGD